MRVTCIQKERRGGTDEGETAEREVVVFCLCVWKEEEEEREEKEKKNKNNDDKAEFPSETARPDEEARGCARFE